MKFTFITNHESHQGDVIVPLYDIDDKGLHLLPAKPAENSNIFKAISDFNPENGACQIVYDQGRRYFLLGCGSAVSETNTDIAFPDVYKAFRKFSVEQGRKLKGTPAVMLPKDPLFMIDFVGAAVNGLVTGSYSTGVSKTQDDSKPHPLQAEGSELVFINDRDQFQSEAVKAAERGEHIGRAQIEAMNLVNLPSNQKTPPYLAEYARKWGKRYNQKVTVLSGEQIEAEGLHALAAVNRGSEYPAQFIVMEYVPEFSRFDPLTKIGLVGKGITFDTGGLSIKTSAGMYFMKSDMGGAATVLGYMEAAARIKPDKHLIAVIPVTDNLIDARSFKPSDIIDSYSGKTIEIMDTDAEGRLILADGIAWLNKNYQPDYMFDFATLTGATVRALGYAAAGMFTPNNSLSNLFSETGIRYGEKVWRFPLWDDYKNDLHSDVADIRNLSGKPVAGGIAAAKFLEFFTEEHQHWVHFDIAGVAFGDNEFGKHKNGTGWGVRLLAEAMDKL